MVPKLLLFGQIRSRPANGHDPWACMVLWSMGSKFAWKWKKSPRLYFQQFGLLNYVMTIGPLQAIAFKFGNHKWLPNYKSMSTAGGSVEEGLWHGWVNLEKEIGGIIYVIRN